MAGQGWKAWTTETLSSTEVQGYLQDQTVMRFDSASQRNSELTSPSDGMVCYLEDSDSLYYREAGVWRPLSGIWPDVTGNAFPSASLRDGDLVWHAGYGALLVRVAGGWRQLHMTYGAASIASYIATATAAGVTAWHAGFLYFDTTLNRLYVSTGGTTFRLVSGAPLADRVTTGWPAAASGWAYVTAGGATWVRNVGQGMAQVYAEFVKSGTAVTPGTTGDVGNITLGSLPTAYLPAEGVPLVSGPSGRTCSGYLSPGGDIILAATTPGGDIAVGQIISLGGTYRLGGVDQ